MSKEKSSNVPANDVKVQKDDRSSLVIGILTLIVVVAIFFALLAALANSTRIKGSMSVVDEQQLRRGNNCTFTYTTDKEIADGEKIVWYVNGEEVSSYDYTLGEKLTLDYTPETCGQLNLQAKIGNKYSQNSVFWVAAPQLTLTAPTKTIVYGENPNIDYTCKGLVCDDCKEDLCYDNCYKLTAEDGTEWDCHNEKFLPVGTYSVEFCKDCTYKDYEVNYLNGTITVLPRKLSVVVADKEYDRTTNVSKAQLSLSGYYENDQVQLQFDKADFADRNVGNNKQIRVENLRLVGKDSGNYVIDDNVICGKITPRKIRLNGITVTDKRYDGTTKATIDKLGRLVGVLDGDSVAIGSVTARYNDANVGNNKQVVLQNILLVGADKDNYTIDKIDKIQSSILQ